MAAPGYVLSLDLSHWLRPCCAGDPAAGGNRRDISSSLDKKSRFFTEPNSPPSGMPVPPSSLPPAVAEEGGSLPTFLFHSHRDLGSYLICKRPTLDEREGSVTCCRQVIRRERVCVPHLPALCPHSGCSGGPTPLPPAVYSLWEVG